MVPTNSGSPPCPSIDRQPGLDDRHRLVLRCLGRLTPPVDLTELATRTFVSDPRSHPDRTRFEPGIGREKDRLHRIDLPQLENRGVLTYDRDRRVITSFVEPDGVLKYER